MRGFIIISTVLFVVAYGCTTVDLYEKSEPIPGHEWQSTFMPEFKFEIKDTAAVYQAWVILRHTEKYNFNNIWLNVISQAPGDPAIATRTEVILADNQKGWLGTGMGDIYEHRLTLVLPEFRISRPGEYRFVIEHLMREDPLRHVMNVGIRIEKKNQ